jgi:hypothetical protein
MLNADPARERILASHRDDEAVAAFLKVVERCQNQADFDQLWRALSPGARILVKQIGLQFALRRRAIRSLIADPRDV